MLMSVEMLWSLVRNVLACTANNREQRDMVT